MRRAMIVMLGIGVWGCRGSAPEVPRETANRIIDAALADEGAWEKLAWLCDRIGHRLAGSPQLEAAVTWAVQTLQRDGHENVRAEPVTVKVWKRGETEVTLVAPTEHTLHVLTLGASPGTPEGGIEAEVMVVADFDELERRKAEVPGKIVVFDAAMKPYDGENHYGEAVIYRADGPLRASQLGAVAALVRSVTARSLGTPHTGQTRWKEATPIPALSLTTEDAMYLHRLADAGAKPRLRIRSTAQLLGDGQSHNVLGELVGREKPEEIVLIGAHLDSWDVGQGAHDDGTGCVMVMQALTLLRKLELRPRRTIRVVLFTNEENGVAGARAYRKQHEGEKHVAAIESDSGGFAPRGWTLQNEGERGTKAKRALERLAPFLGRLGLIRVMKGEGGTDVSNLEEIGALVLGHAVEGRRYFDYHHTDADTLDKVDPTELKQNVAVMALTAWWLAEREEAL
jgi:carboxypeptidase Q